MVLILEWLWPAVSPTQVTNLQYALSAIAQAYAAMLGILLTVGVAFTQLGEYRIPVGLLIRLSLAEAMVLAIAAATVISPVVALSFGILELYRICFVLFVTSMAMLPLFVARVVRRTQPAFYVPYLLRAKDGSRLHGEAVVSLGIQAANHRDWDTLSMMSALLGQLRRPDSIHNLERGWGYQQNLPALIHHLVDDTNDRGLRIVLRTVAVGASAVPTTAILDSPETHSGLTNWLRFRWLVRPAWVHKLDRRIRGAGPLFVVPRWYDYGILMHLTTCLSMLIHRNEDGPGEPYLPKRVSEFKEWAWLLTKIVYSVYLLDEARADEPTLPDAESALWQMRTWEALLGTVETKKLRDAVRAAPDFTGSLGPGFPLHRPKELRDEWYARDAMRTPARIRAANRLSQASARAQLRSYPEDAAECFWPHWDIQDDKVIVSGRRFATAEALGLEGSAGA